jgi:hypothetical protein
MKSFIPHIFVDLVRMKYFLLDIFGNFVVKFARGTVLKESSHGTCFDGKIISWLVPAKNKR